MEERLLRYIAEQYLVPLFSGAELDKESEKSSKSDSLVASKRMTTIAFKVDREDNYRLLLKRSQRFAKNNGEAVVREIDVVWSFVGILYQVFSILNDESKNLMENKPSQLRTGSENHLEKDIFSAFQRRVVARSVADQFTSYRTQERVISRSDVEKEREKTILSGIDQLDRWGRRLYEGAPIASAIGYYDDVQSSRSVQLQDIAENDFGKVLGNGHDTLLEFDFRNKFVSHKILNPGNEIPQYCPIQQSAIAGWTNDGEQNIAITLNRLGEILILKGEQLLFSYRSGTWRFLTHRPVVSQMGQPNHSRNVYISVYETCLDTSFARTGACIGVIDGRNRRRWRDLVDIGDQLDQKRSHKTQVIYKMVSGRKFYHLDRKLRQEIAAIDGATVISHEGEVLAVGAILKIPGGSEGGGRRAAATALGKMGLGIKVSQDGGIIGFRGNKTVFRVMY